MATMNRLYKPNNERKSARLISKDEYSFNLMRSFKVEHKRENCVLEIVEV